MHYLTNVLYTYQINLVPTENDAIGITKLNAIFCQQLPPWYGSNQFYAIANLIHCTY